MGSARNHQNSEAALKEVSVREFIPYGNHVTQNIIKLIDGSYVFIVKCEGAAHESADPADLNSWHNMLNNFMRNIASPQTALWSHVVRREYREFPRGEFKNKFAEDYNRKYRAHILGMGLMVNELYISVVYQPTPNKVMRLFDFGKKDEKAIAEQQGQDIEAVNDLIDKTLSGLDRYNPKILDMYEHNGIMFSKAKEFLGYLVDGEWRRHALLRAEIRDTLATTRPYFGKGGLLTLKAPSSVQYGAAVAIENHTSRTYPGILNGLLGAPFPFVLTQSFTFISKTVAISRMKRQSKRMENSGDVAVSQITELDLAMDDVQSNKYVMGAHHFSLIVRDTNKDKLNEHVSLAGTVLSNAGMKWCREDVSLAGCFWSQLPGNFKYRNRVGDITSRNFAGFSALHNYPIGRIDGAQWGNAVTIFPTAAGSPYCFNFHKVDPDPEAKTDPDHKELAHTMVIGQSGSGKTVLENHFLVQLQKFMHDQREDGTCVLFDKDEGASIAVKQLGGRYWSIKNGLKTGWQPLHLDPTPGNLLFVQRLYEVLVHHPSFPLKPSEQKEIANAVERVMGNPLRGIPGLARYAQRMSSVQELLDCTDENGIGARLQMWCEGHPNGWLFDNEEDALDLKGTPVLGFDVTDFLDNPVTRTPTIMYLLHRITELLDGRRVPILLDEFWKLIGDDVFAPIIEDMLVTIRKKNGFLVMFTQSPEQVMKSSISYAIIQQSATKIFLPNPSADRESYVNGFKLTQAEFEIVKELGEKSRRFLVKQGANSVVCELNLKGFNDELAVLSANTSTAALVERIIAAEHEGVKPEEWLPIFHRMRKGVVNDE